MSNENGLNKNHNAMKSHCSILDLEVAKVHNDKVNWRMSVLKDELPKQSLLFKQVSSPL